MSRSYATNTRVEWDWGNGTGTGNVRRVYNDDVEKTIKGSRVSREASKDNPAYLIEQDDGDEVLKSHSELRKAS